ncbi:hypothetical protein SDC9_08657 [bioreactor metagenome]|uniref:Uncharacterized protein n=1 Tax=bioreactor metagenome TaxID=1076179 RepID=A0A644T995_9ZZZZ
MSIPRIFSGMATQGLSLSEPEGHPLQTTCNGSVFQAMAPVSICRAGARMCSRQVTALITAAKGPTIITDPISAALPALRPSLRAPWPVHWAITMQIFLLYLLPLHLCGRTLPPTARRRYPDLPAISARGLISRQPSLIFHHLKLTTTGETPPICPIRRSRQTMALIT